ncbi:hypothetical protein E2C01_007501 [Portunus trituberculatus]|uniref:Uncharacterized protein n=1 Tax=Portunus trituberculatus TaxID=210409 RepID=A0A5B7CZ70_PORTR|nr:hypothetical protein [Portunus trituberculatus]
MGRTLWSRRGRGVAKRATAKRHAVATTEWLNFLWTIEGPHSSYSCLVINICLKVESEARMDPPIQTEYPRSGGAMILICIDDGASVVISFSILSAKPGQVVLPPDNTILA